MSEPTIVHTWKEDPPVGSQRRVYAWMRGKPEFAALVDIYSRPHEVELGLDVVWAEQSWFCANIEEFDTRLRDVQRELDECKRDAELFRMLQAHLDRKPHESVFSVYEYGTKVFALDLALKNRAAIELSKEQQHE